MFKLFVMFVVVFTTVSDFVYAEENSRGTNDAYILTPPVSPKPRINGAKVFGVRPGAPLLFKVAASGIKPMSYFAKKLPKGLKIDKKSGVISGRLKKRGEYIISLKVSNKLGNAYRKLTIKVGDDISLTPPMGWNSWYCHSELVSDKAIREVAKAMHDKGLIDHGWTYVNIDDCWQGERGGKFNAIQPNERFPDMEKMCDYVHGLGLKVGIYSTPWSGTYAGFIGGTAPNKEGDYSAFYLPESKRLQKHQFFGRCPGSIKKKLNKIDHWFNDRDAKQWAEWGFDYVKMDWKPNDVPTTKRIFEDLRKCGRDMVLSLSNSAPYENANGLSKYANCWRTTGDIHDNWRSISKIGFAQEKWAKYTRPGHWNDPDMLQVGSIGKPNRKNSSFKPTHLTPDEQYMQVSMWSLVSAPLLLSCDIASMDKFTLSLLTNDEVIEVNQDPLANPVQRIVVKKDCEVWYKALEDGSLAVGLFNRGGETEEISISWEQLNLKGLQNVRDLWRQKDLGQFKKSFTTNVNSHGVVLVRVSKEK